MKIKKETLLNLVSIVKGAADRKTPVLSNVLVKSGDNKLYASCNDGSLEIECCGEYLGEPVEFCVNAEKFEQVLKNAPAESDVTIEDGDSLIVKYKRSRFKLEKTDPENYPSMPMVNGENIVFKSGELLGAIARTSYAMANNDVRYFLNGMCIDLECSRFVCTDGHRMAYCDISPENEISSDRKIIIPARTVSKLSVLQGADIEMCVGNTLASFVSGNIKITTNLIDGKYPDYMRIVPDSGLDWIDVNGKELKLSINRVASVATDKGNSTLFSFNNSELQIKTQNALNESAVDSIEYKDENGITRNIALNYRYALDCINATDSAVLNVGIPKEEGKPILVKSGNMDYHLIMPMRI